MSLIEVLAASALGLVVIGGMGYAIFGLGKESQKIKQMADIETTYGLMKKFMGNIAVCRQTLLTDSTGAALTPALPTNTAPLSLTTIRSPGPGGGTVQFATEANDATGNHAKIISMQMKPLKQRDEMSEISKESASAVLSVTFRKTGTFLGSPLEVRDIPLSFRVDAAKNILDCSDDVHGEDTQRAVASLGTCGANNVAAGVNSTGGLNCQHPTVEQIVNVQRWLPPECDVRTYTGTESCSGPRNGNCTVTIDFSGVIPNGCKAQSVHADLLYFNGYGSPCSSPGSGDVSAGSPDTAGGYAGKKVAVWAAHLDSSAHRIALTSLAGGWGSCGGNPCNACISDVRLTISTVPQ